MRLSRILVAAAVATVVSAPQVAAAQCETTVGNIVANCSFENPDIGGGATFPGAPLADRTANPEGVVERWVDGFNVFHAHDGSSHVELKVNQATTLSQHLTTAVGDRYALSFWAAHRINGSNFSQIDVYIDDGRPLTPAPRVAFGPSPGEACLRSSAHEQVCSFARHHHRPAFAGPA